MKYNVLFVMCETPETMQMFDQFNYDVWRVCEHFIYHAGRTLQTFGNDAWGEGAGRGSIYIYRYEV